MINVTRRPYSFNGDSGRGRSGGGGLAGAGTPEGSEPTWHESLLGYMGSEAGREAAERGMYALGARAGVRLDYGVRTNWQPVKSQRLMLWAARHGKQEEYMDALGRMHFEQRRSASHTATLLEAAAEVGLDVGAARAFLEGDGLEEDVWQSYGETIRKHGISAIPYFIFGFQGMRTPFRTDGTSEAIAVNGSGDPEQFLGVLEALYQVFRDTGGVADGA